jgi:SAM-dependent methyltransferase
MMAVTTINFAIKEKGYKSYLELGCQRDITFSAVKCASKTGVDSKIGGTHRMTTDEFFAQNTETFDIIFIDAYHEHNQVMQDFKNSLKVLNPGGLILMHDCNPDTAFYEGQTKCGTAWRTLTHLRMNLDLSIVTGDYHFGVGLVCRAPNPQPLANIPPMNNLHYTDLQANREEYLNLKSWPEVMQWVNQTTFE